MPSFALLSLLTGLFASSPNHPPFTYHLEHPDIVFDMPDEIKEISGIGLTADCKFLAAVNDEAGIVFFLDKKTGEIQSRVPFRESGDFEGVEIVGDDAWVVKSSGSLYQIKKYAEPNPEIVQYKSFLNKENDVEGLAFDAKNNRLLLGCKGTPVGEDAMLTKIIYAFDLETKTVADRPAFTIALGNLRGFLLSSGEDEAEEKLERIQEGADMKFSPSGIAIHPKTGDIYITSARGNTLLVLDANGNILHLERLKKSTHAQPEGICFDSDGTLYIANEGGDGTPGKIYGFYAKN